MTPLASLSKSLPIKQLLKRNKMKMHKTFLPTLLLLPVLAACSTTPITRSSPCAAIPAAPVALTQSPTDQQLQEVLVQLKVLREQVSALTQPSSSTPSTQR